MWGSIEGEADSPQTTRWCVGMNPSCDLSVEIVRIGGNKDMNVAHDFQDINTLLQCLAR